MVWSFQHFLKWDKMVELISILWFVAGFVGASGAMLMVIAVMRNRPFFAKEV